MGLLAAAAIGTAGAIGGALLSKQKAPGIAPPVNAQQVQTSAITGNQDNLAASENLSSQTNSFNQSQATALMNQALPGFSAAQSQLMAASSQYQQNASSGTLSADQTSQISQFAAEQGVSRGTSGQFNGFDVVRDFGMNLQAYQASQQNQALGTLSAAYGMSPKINPMSPSSMFVSPGQALDVAHSNQSAAQAGLNASAAASNANSAALGGAVASAGSLFSSFASMGAGAGGAAAGSAAGSVALSGNGASDAAAMGLGTMSNGVYTSNGG